MIWREGIEKRQLSFSGKINSEPNDTNARSNKEIKNRKVGEGNIDENNSEVINM